MIDKNDMKMIKLYREAAQNSSLSSDVEKELRDEFYVNEESDFDELWGEVKLIFAEKEEPAFRNLAILFFILGMNHNARLD